MCLPGRGVGVCGVKCEMVIVNASNVGGVTWGKVLRHRESGVGDLKCGLFAVKAITAIGIK